MRHDPHHPAGSLTSRWLLAAAGSQPFVCLPAADRCFYTSLHASHCAPCSDARRTPATPPDTPHARRPRLPTVASRTAPHARRPRLPAVASPTALYAGYTPPARRRPSLPPCYAPRQRGAVVELLPWRTHAHRTHATSATDFTLNAPPPARRRHRLPLFFAPLQRGGGGRAAAVAAPRPPHAHHLPHRRHADRPPPAIPGRARHGRRRPRVNPSAARVPVAAVVLRLSVRAELTNGGRLAAGGGRSTRHSQDRGREWVGGVGMAGRMMPVEKRERD